MSCLIIAETVRDCTPRCTSIHVSFCFSFCRNSPAVTARQIVDFDKVRSRFVQSLPVRSCRIRFSAEWRRLLPLRHFRRPDHAYRPFDVIDENASATVDVNGHDHAGRSITTAERVSPSPQWMTLVSLETETLLLSNYLRWGRIRSVVSY